MRRLSLLFATLFCAAVAQAAGDREVRGRILDMQGRPVPEAVITVRGMGRHTVSDTAGVYRFPHLEGTRSLTASAIGYGQLTRTNLQNTTN